MAPVWDSPRAKARVSQIPLRYQLSTEEMPDTTAYPELVPKTPLPPGPPPRVPPTLDAVDRDLVTTLLADGRASNVALARSAGIAESTALARVRSLHERGVVTGYAVQLDYARLGPTHPGHRRGAPGRAGPSPSRCLRRARERPTGGARRLQRQRFGRLPRAPGGPISRCAARCRAHPLVRASGCRPRADVARLPQPSRPCTTPATHLRRAVTAYRAWASARRPCRRSCRAGFDGAGPRAATACRGSTPSG